MNIKERQLGYFIFLSPSFVQRSEHIYVVFTVYMMLPSMQILKQETPNRPPQNPTRLAINNEFWGIPCSIVTNLGLPELLLVTFSFSREEKRYMTLCYRMPYIMRALINIYRHIAKGHIFTLLDLPKHLCSQVGH